MKNSAYDDTPFEVGTEADRLRARMRGQSFGGLISGQIESEVKIVQGHIAVKHRRAGINSELAYRDWLAVKPAIVYQSALAKAGEPGMQYLAEGPDVADLRQKRTGAEAFLAAYELRRGINASTCEPLSGQDRLERRVRLAAARKDDPYLPARLDREVGELLREGGAWITSINACETDLGTWQQKREEPWITQKRRGLELTH